MFPAGAYMHIHAVKYVYFSIRCHPRSKREISMDETQFANRPHAVKS